MGTLSVAVAVLLAAVSVSALSTIGLTERPKEPNPCREVSMDEYIRMAEYSAAEVESGLGMAYDDYCAYAGELRGSAFSVDSRDIIACSSFAEAGRGSYANGFDLHLGPRLEDADAGLLACAIRESLPMLPAGLSGTVAAEAIRYLAENDVTDGITLRYRCCCTVCTPYGRFDVYRYPRIVGAGPY